jgi:transposase-like protein
VITVAVRWYLRYGLSYRDVKELLAERGVTVDHVTVYGWVQTFTCEFIDAARPARRATGDRWFVDETYVKVAGRWTYLYRAVDQHGQVIDVLLSRRRDAVAARSFTAQARKVGPVPIEVTTDRTPVYARVLDELVAGARHIVEQYANNIVEADHGKLKSPAAPDAWTEATALSTNRRGRPRIRAEPGRGERVGGADRDRLAAGDQHRRAGLHRQRLRAWARQRRDVLLPGDLPKRRHGADAVHLKAGGRPPAQRADAE